MPDLKAHILQRMEDLLGLEIPYTDKSNSLFSPVLFKNDRMYEHRIIRFNYTTYDIRRAQDVVNPGTTHCNIMVLSQDRKQDKETNNSSHCFHYGRVIGIYHVNAVYNGPGMANYHPHRMDFLWVRWYELQRNQTNSPYQLNQLSFPPIESNGSMGFVNPKDIIRGSHIIPMFRKGRDGKEKSKLVQDSKDWNSYYVSQYVKMSFLQCKS